jgi:hypothetical protein
MDRQIVANQPVRGQKARQDSHSLEGCRDSPDRSRARALKLSRANCQALLNGLVEVGYLFAPATRPMCRARRWP